MEIVELFFLFHNQVESNLFYNFIDFIEYKKYKGIPVETTSRIIQGPEFKDKQRIVHKITVDETWREEDLLISFAKWLMYKK